MALLFKRLFKLHIMRYGLVGGLGIPINDAALFLFAQLLLLPLPLAEACAFLLSNFINFTLNQFFTYREQVAGIHGWEWLRRYLRGQITSLSASLLAYLVALSLVYFLQVDKYLANPVGIVVAFLYNFFLSRKLVFRPPPTPTAPAEACANNPEARVESTHR
jgi:putative flippase GtrA